MTFHTQPDVKIKERKIPSLMVCNYEKLKNEKTCEIVESKEWDI